MRINQFFRDFLFFLFALYSAQGWLYPQGSFLSKTCIVAIILISGAYFIKTLFLEDKKNLFYNGWTLLLILNLAGFMFKFDMAEGPARDMFKNILGCLLPFYPFYYFAKQDQLKPVHLIRFALVMLPVIIIQFFRNQIYLQLEMSTANVNVVNNIAYSFVSLIPFVFLIKKKRLISGALLALLLMFIIQSSKRGAIVAGSIGLLMYCYYLIRTIESHNKIYGYFSVIIVMVCLVAFAYKTSMQNEYMITRMASILEGNTSGRDEIYRKIFNYWHENNSAIKFLFGFGFAASLDITGGSYAHNDWLELLSNFGLVGICAYLYLFYSAVKSALNNEWLEDKRILLLTVVFIWFFVSLVSMWYTSLDGFMQASILGYLIGTASASLE